MKELIKELLVICKEVEESENFIDHDFGAGVGFVKNDWFKVEPNSCLGEDQSLATDINARLANLRCKMACAVHYSDAAELRELLSGRSRV